MSGSEVSRGGRYDNLTGVFGMDGMSGVGISFGADRIFDVLNQLELYPVDSFEDHATVVREFRREGRKTICCL